MGQANAQLGIEMENSGKILNSRLKQKASLISSESDDTSF